MASMLNDSQECMLFPMILLSVLTFLIFYARELGVFVPVPILLKCQTGVNSKHVQSSDNLVKLYERRDLFTFPFLCKLAGFYDVQQV